VTPKDPSSAQAGFEIERQFADPRLELVRLLHESAQIEHALMLQYLYAAFSMRPRYADVSGVGSLEPSSRTLMGIAIEEMHHLRDVNRILVELGAAPSLTRQDFPYEPDIYPFPMRLERLSRASVARYVYAEAPRGALDPDSLANAAERSFAEAVLGLLPHRRVNHVGSLYGTVLARLAELREREADLDVSAWRERVERIKQSGEGDHYGFFRALFLGDLPGLSGPGIWDDPASEGYPSLPFARDPTALPAGASYPSGEERTLAELGNCVYWAVLMLLDLGYRGQGEVADAVTRRSQELMSAVLLPVASLLAERGHGLPFDPLAMGVPPGRSAQEDVAFARSFLAQALALAGALPPRLRDLLASASASLERLHRDLADLVLELPGAGSREKPVVVAGSGPAGLAAALVLASRGVPVRVVEASTLVGGKVSSTRSNGRSTEHGVHGWWPNYLNFDRLLELAGVDPGAALAAAKGSALVADGGRIHRVRFPFRLPSPLFVIEHSFRARLLSIRDALALLPAAIHLLAFGHRRDYARYDGLSLEALSNLLRVPDRARSLLFRPFALNFDYAPPDAVSAASILSALQFYLLHSKSAIVPRWSRGLPRDRIFGPLVKAIEDRGGRVDCSARLESVDIEDGRVGRARLADCGVACPGGASVIDEFRADELPRSGFAARAGGQALAGRVGDRIVAFPNRCTHQGGRLVWSGERFVCQSHGSEFDREGKVLWSPEPIEPLAPLEVRERGERVQILGFEGRRGIPCSDVIIATHLPAAAQILARSPGVAPGLIERMGRLGTTPVTVVRLWFRPEATVPEDLECACTPGAGFIDNFFHLNRFDPEYDAEGQVVEVHACRGKDASAEEVLDRVFQDLSLFCPGLSRDLLVDSFVQPHPEVFTLYSPGGMADRPGTDAGVAGLHLAGDWTLSERPVWMMERAVVSGLEAANRVLRSRGLEPAEILELAPEGFVLTAARWLARGLRRLLWSPDFPGSRPPRDV
jgi:uncharacterized protein with NAD-binding domain and iron-sulfur cluster/nitrite reductase/ring-hydroxylating ferredoxin subunit